MDKNDFPELPDWDLLHANLEMEFLAYSDKEFLQWIYNRLKNIHKDDPEENYMRRLKELVENMEKK